ncbi:MAG: T9SS type A sorting domain-containing protein [Flavobacteriales bacterium]|nr:T9SS type A sorting domain-containing protein [Flavobacteriales bacterium]
MTQFFRVLALSLIVLFVQPQVGFSQSDSCNLLIGTNLSGPVDFGTEWPFVDIMNYSRSWGTQNVAWYGGGNNPWDSQLANSVAQDADGYPTVDIPFYSAGQDTTQVFYTVWANTDGLPQGNYVCLYDGTGIIDFTLNATVISNQPGRVEFTFTPQVNGIIGLKIMQSDANDHVRNIRVLLPGHEFDYMNTTWETQWVSKLQSFNTLRFMDWGHTNNSTLSQWSERPLVSDVTYTPQGIPYELWIQACNDLQKDAWVCVPHLADENYIRQMAQLFRDNLDPNLKIYVEYSNETWNWIFTQTSYLNDNGNQNVVWPERTVPFVQNCLDLWTDEFSGQMDRIVRVVGVQGGWQDVSNRVVFNMTPGSFDAFSPAAYFNMNATGYTDLANLGASATGADVLAFAQQGMSESFSYLVSQKETIADSLDIPMLFYEGGQHLTPEPFGSVQPYNPALVAANQNNGMYDLYMDWMDSLRSLGSAENPILFMNFSFINNVSGQYGSWGVLEHQWNDQAPYPNAPKYRALLDNIYDCSNSLVTGIDDESDPNSELNIYPNPTTGFFHIEFEDGDFLEVIDMMGRVVISKQLANRNKITVDLTANSKGIYLIRIRSKKGSNQKLVLVE